MATTLTPTVSAHPSWLKKEALKILGIEEAFWVAWGPSFKTEIQLLLAELAPIAIAAVTSYATTGKSGIDKNSAAAATIKADITAAGIAATTSAINCAVELAVQQLPSNDNPVKASS